MKSLLVLAIAIATTLTGCAGVKQAPAAAAGCKPPPSNLVWKDIQPGKGDATRFRAAVLLNYAGWLYDGCTKDLKGVEFDSSAGRATPLGFIVGAGRVIRGWDEGVIGMREGGRRLLLVPADKAYGAAGMPPKIPPNAALVFEVELVKIIQQGPGQ